MTRKAANALAWLAVLGFCAADVRAQENPPCPPDHVSRYGPDTDRNDCLHPPQANDKRHEALLKEQQLRIQQLRREQLERSRSLSSPQDILRAEQQARVARAQRLIRRR